MNFDLLLCLIITRNFVCFKSNQRVSNFWRNTTLEHCQNSIPPRAVFVQNRNAEIPALTAHDDDDDDADVYVGTYVTVCTLTHTYTHKHVKNSRVF